MPKTQLIRNHHLWTRDTIKNLSGNVTLDIVGDLILNPGGNDLKISANADGSHALNIQNDGSCSGCLHIFNPSSSVFVKHFIGNFNHMYEESGGDEYSWENFKAGYFNTTTALTRFQFKYSSGDIDAGVIKLYGIS